ncbi:histidine phosphatase family protein [Pendulispora brunnea]|uniref:Histidine phosphatase family protein n=1 Tax=Pendulispora brunnea TaxID=2905690 RepID=A0ABZ2K9D3_9BACT
MPDLILIRHGETEWTLSGRHTGRTDIALTPRGEEQARSLAAWISRRTIARAFVSPLARARKTAELAGLRTADFALEPDLQEWDYGAYEGRTRPEIHQERPTWDLWKDGVPPGTGAHPGESIEQVAARLDGVLVKVRAVLAENRGDVVAVAHGHSLRTLAARWLEQAPQFGARLRLEPAHFSILGFEHALPVIRQWNFGPGGE